MTVGGDNLQESDDCTWISRLSYFTSCYQCIYHLGGGGYMDAMDELQHITTSVMRLVVCDIFIRHCPSKVRTYNS